MLGPAHSLMHQKWNVKVYYSKFCTVLNQLMIEAVMMLKNIVKNVLFHLLLIVNCHCQQNTTGWAKSNSSKFINICPNLSFVHSCQNLSKGPISISGDNTWMEHPLFYWMLSNLFLFKVALFKDFYLFDWLFYPNP